MGNTVTRNELRERVRKILVGTLLNEEEKVSDNLLDTVIKYYFPKQEKNIINGEEKWIPKKQKIIPEEEKFLERGYEDLIKKEREKISGEIDINKVKVIVSAFSLSPKNSLLEEYPFEKDLRIFDNIEKIYLFYTKETENKFNEYKKNCKFKEKIEGVEIDGREVNETYKKLKELVLKNKVNKDDTVLDMTLGMKTISIAFYRIAVERQIKAINWNEKFLSSYTQISENEFEENEKGPTPRIALSAKLSLMRDPIKESTRIESTINNNIKKGNFEVVRNLYELNGNNNMAYFYKELNTIFSIDKIIEYNDLEKFYEDVEKILDKILDRSKEFTSTEIFKTRKAVAYLANLTWIFSNRKKGKESNFKLVESDFFENDYADFKRYSETVDDEVNSKEREDSLKKIDLDNWNDSLEEIMIYLKFKYIILNDKPFFYFEKIINDMKKSQISKSIVEKLKEYIQKVKNKNEKVLLKKIYEFIFSNKDDCYQKIRKYDMESTLLEILESKLSFKNGILILPIKLEYDLEEFNLKIDFNKEKKLIKILRLRDHRIPIKYEPIHELLGKIEKKGYDSEVKSDRIKEIFNPNRVKNFDQNITKFKNVVRDINEVINKKLIDEAEKEGKKIKIKIPNFIETSSVKKDYSIKISDKWKI